MVKVLAKPQHGILSTRIVDSKIGLYHESRGWPIARVHPSRLFRLTTHRCVAFTERIILAWKPYGPLTAILIIAPSRSSRQGTHTVDSLTVGASAALAQNKWEKM